MQPVARGAVSVTRALVLTGALVLGAHVTTSAEPGRQILPVLRLDYFVATRGQLAKTLDPALVVNPTDAEVVKLVNAGLVRLTPAGRVAPDLATWTVSRDHLVYRFTLRRAARFSDGRPVTAAAAAYSLERALSPATASDIALRSLGAIQGAADYHGGRTPALAGLRVIGKRVLRISLSAPSAPFLTMLASPAGLILDPAGPDGDLTRSCKANQGAGPFRFRCWPQRADLRGSFYPVGQQPSYTLLPNPYYYGPRPRVQIELPAIGSIGQAYRAYVTGKLEVTPLPPELLPHWRASAEYHHYPAPFLSVLIPDARIAPFDDVHCRRALAYAIDRERLAGTVLQGAASPAYSMVPGRLFGSYPGDDNPHFDPSRAREELAQCPGRDTPVKVTYPVGVADASAFYGAIVAMLNAAGFAADLNPVSAGDWTDRQCMLAPLTTCSLQLMGYGWQRGSSDVLDLLWRQYFPDPDNSVAQPLRCGSGDNKGGWCDSTFDTLVDQAAVEWDRANRALLYRQAQHLALDEGGWIVLLEEEAHKLVKPYVHGLTGSAIAPDMQPQGGDWSRVTG